jgi:hypothetical protein
MNSASGAAPAQSPKRRREDVDDIGASPEPTLKDLMREMLKMNSQFALNNRRLDEQADGLRALQTEVAEHRASTCEAIEGVRNEVREQLKATDEKMTSLEKRFEQLSSNCNSTAAASRASSSSSAVPRGVPDPFSVRSSRNRSAPSPFEFISRKVFLRGWCAFKAEDRDGLTQTQCGILAEQVLAKLGGDVKNFILPGDKLWQAPRFRNRQITFALTEDAPSNAAWLLQEAMNNIIKVHKIRTPHDKEVYAARDKPPWQKARDACVKRAELFTTGHLGGIEGYRIVPDYPAGKLYVENAAGVASVVGIWKGEDEGWSWEPKLFELWPKCVASEAEAAMAFSS